MSKQTDENQPEQMAPHEAAGGASGEVSDSGDAPADAPLFSSPEEALANLQKLRGLRDAAKDRLAHLDARLTEGIEHAAAAGASQQDAADAAGR